MLTLLLAQGLFMDVLERAAAVGLWVGGVAAAAGLAVVTARKLYREYWKDAVEPLAAELRPQAAPGTGDSMTMRQLVEQVSETVTQVAERVGDTTAAVLLLDKRLSEDQAGLRSEIREHKRMTDEARKGDQHRVSALEHRVGVLETILGRRGLDEKLAAHADASVRLAEHLDEQRATPPVGVPKVP